MIGLGDSLCPLRVILIEPLPGGKPELHRLFLPAVGIPEHPLDNGGLLADDGVVGDGGADEMPAADEGVLRGKSGVVRFDRPGAAHVIQTAVIPEVLRHLYDELVFFVETPIWVGLDLNLVHPGIPCIQISPRIGGLSHIIAVDILGEPVAGFVMDGIRDHAFPGVPVVFHCDIQVDIGLPLPDEIVRDLHIRHPQAPVRILFPHAQHCGAACGVVRPRCAVHKGQALCRRTARIVCRRKVGNGLAAGKFQSQGTVEHAVLLPGGPVPVPGERIDLHAVVRLRGGALLHVDCVVPHHTDEVDGGLIVVGDHGVAVVRGYDPRAALHLLGGPLVIRRIASSGLPVHGVDAVPGDEVIAAVDILPVCEDGIEEIEISLRHILRVQDPVDIDAEMAPGVCCRVISVGAVALCHQGLVGGLNPVGHPVAWLIGGDDPGGMDLAGPQICEAAVLRVPCLAGGEPVVGSGGDRPQEGSQGGDGLPVVPGKPGGGVGHGAVPLPARRHGGAVEDLSLHCGVAGEDGAGGLMLIQVHHDGRHVGAAHPLSLPQCVVRQDGADVDLVTAAGVVQVRLVGHRHKLRNGAGLSLRQRHQVERTGQVARSLLLVLIDQVGPLSVRGQAEQGSIVFGGHKLRLPVGIGVAIDGHNA